MPRRTTLMTNSMKGSPNFFANIPIITSLKVFQALDVPRHTIPWEGGGFGDELFRGD
jgi:hypothetical protein